MRDDSPKSVGGKNDGVSDVLSETSRSRSKTRERVRVKSRSRSKKSKNGDGEGDIEPNVGVVFGQEGEEATVLVGDRQKNDSGRSKLERRLVRKIDLRLCSIAGLLCSLNLLVCFFFLVLVNMGNKQEVEWDGQKQNLLKTQ